MAGPETTVGSIFSRWAKMGNSEPSALAQVLYGVADVAWRVGDLETLNSYITESLSLARALDNSTLELMSLNRLGTMAYLKGDLATRCV